MSKAGMIAALEHGKKLRSFPSQAEAEGVLFAERDALLEQLLAGAQRAQGPALDFSPESLKAVEQWYFELLEGEGWARTGLERTTLEGALAVYFGAVVVRNLSSFSWAVEVDAFTPGKYELHVRRPLFSMRLGTPFDLARRPKNSRHDSMRRAYQRCEKRNAASR